MPQVILSICFVGKCRGREDRIAECLLNASAGDGFSALQHARRPCDMRARPIQPSPIPARLFGGKTVRQVAQCSHDMEAITLLQGRLPDRGLT